MKLKPTFEQWTLKGTPVFLRADLNVPIARGRILNDYRLRAILPTLDALIKKGAIVILATHLGRPKNQEPELSTEQLVAWFEQKGYSITFCKDLYQAEQAVKKAKPSSIILLENLRFFPGEKAADTAFAHELKKLADYYVNDAFGTAHRTDASLGLLATLFPKEQRSIGYLIPDELNNLSILHHPQKPFCVIIGGGKVADKLPLIEQFIGIADTILLCPAIVFTFLKAAGKPIGKSLVDDGLITKAAEIMQHAQERGTQLLFPKDYQIALETLSGPLEMVNADQFPENGIGLSIGPKTITYFKPYIHNAKTIFLNGMMGLTNRADTQTGMEALLKEIAAASGKSIIAGGDSVAIVEKLKLKGIDYCSTGGGAALQYISGKELPALTPFF